MITLAIVVVLVLLAVASTLSAGLGLDAGAARSPAARRTIAAALVANVALVPLAAGALAWAAPDEDVRLALVLLAAAPGGATGPLLALLVGGDATRVAVAFATLALVSVVAPLGLLALDGSLAIALPAAGVVAVQLGPLALGAWIRARAPEHAARIEPPVRRLGTALLVAVVVLLLFDRGALLGTLGLGAMAVMTAMVLATLAAGWLAAREDRAALAVLTAVRNLTLVLLLAEVVTPGGRATAVVGAYGLVMYVAVIGACRLLTQRREANSKAT